MVDFRYHLVSLVSVFLALAVGIILGAGPLQDSIGTALTGQVESLRVSRDDARSVADSAKAELEVAASQIDAAGKQLVNGTLKGRKVAFVALGGASEDSLNEARSGLESAGAEITGTVTLTDIYASTRSATYRSALAQTLAQYAGEDPGAGEAKILTSALSYVLRAGSADANASIIMDAMRASDNELITVDGDISAPVSAVVVVVPEKVTVAEGNASLKAELATVESSYMTLTEVMAEKGPTVIVGPGVQGDSAIIKLRPSDTGSSVDSLEMAAGPYNVAIAVASEITGTHVYLGQGKGAAPFGTRVSASTEG